MICNLLLSISTRLVFDHIIFVLFGVVVVLFSSNILLIFNVIVVGFLKFFLTKI